MPKVTLAQAREKAMETRKLARVGVDPEQHRDAKLKACAALDGASLQLSRRFGYRRLLIFLRREGFIVNHKRLFGMCREERLMVRKRAGRKRALGSRTPMPGGALPNDRRSLDFVSDQLDSGRRFRILAIYDDCTRECLAVIADVSLSSRRVARELDRPRAANPHRF
jgi:putative transposase